MGVVYRKHEVPVIFIFYPQCKLFRIFQHALITHTMVELHNSVSVRKKVTTNTIEVFYHRCSVAWLLGGINAVSAP